MPIPCRPSRVDRTSPYTSTGVACSALKGHPTSCLGKYCETGGICYLPHRQTTLMCFCNKTPRGETPKSKTYSWSHKDSRLLSLPGELRIHVYRFALSSNHKDTGERALLSLSYAEALELKQSQLREPRRSDADTEPKSLTDHDCPIRRAPPRSPVLLECRGLLGTRKCIRDEVLRYIYDHLRLKIYLDSNIPTHLPINALENIRTISIDFTALSQRIHPDFLPNNTILSLAELGQVLSKRTDINNIRVLCRWQPTNERLSFEELVADFTIGVLGTMEQFPKLRAKDGVGMMWMTSRFAMSWRPEVSFSVKDLVDEGYVDSDMVEMQERMIRLVEDGRDAREAWETAEEVGKHDVVV